MTRIRSLSLIIILAALIAVYFGNLSYNNYQAQAAHYINGNLWDEDTCSSCHPGAQTDVLNSYHLEQKARYGSIDNWDPLFINLIEAGYLNGPAKEWGIDLAQNPNLTLIINYTDDIIGFTTSDCRVCHLNGEFEWNAALTEPAAAGHTGTSDEAFLDTPSDGVCAGRCHQKDVAVRGVMWSSNNYADYDAHANASTGCIQCHLTTNHQIGRNSTIDSQITEVFPMKQCIDCHFEVTHGMYADAHLVNVSCESCHIPMLPGGAQQETIYAVNWTSGNRDTVYRSEDFAPVLAWFNGSVKGIPHPSDRNDTGVMLKPFNVIKVSWWDEGTDPVIVSGNSTERGRPVMLSLVRKADKDDNGQVSVPEMRSLDVDNDGAPDFPDAVIRTVDVYYSISHNIVSNESDNIMGTSALWCSDCHGTNQTRIDWNLLGYETDPAETDPPTNFSSYNLTVEIVPLRPKPVEVESEPKLFNDLFGSGDQ